MLTKCLKNRQSDMLKDLQKFAFGQDQEGALPLTINKRYVVSAIKIQNDHTFYLIMGDDGELKGWPWWYPAELFSIIQDYRPADWTSYEEKAFQISGFPEIVNDPEGSFYNALEDGEKAAVETFLRYYKKYAEYYDILYADTVE